MKRMYSKTFYAKMTTIINAVSLVMVFVMLISMASFNAKMRIIREDLSYIKTELMAIEAANVQMKKDMLDKLNAINNTTQQLEPVEDGDVKVETLPAPSVPVVLELVSDTTDVTRVSNATAEELNNAIKETCKWMYEYNPNIGEVYVRLEKEYNVNAYFALAVSFSEVGVGEMSNLAKRDNNTYGLMNGKKYDTIEDCVEYFFYLIDKYYVGEGRMTVEQIADKYCLGNQTWIKNVTVFMRKLPERSR